MLMQEGNTFNSRLVLFNCVAQYISREADSFSGAQKYIQYFMEPGSPLLSKIKKKNILSHWHLSFVILVKFASYIATIRSNIILAYIPLLPKWSFPFMCKYYGQISVRVSHLQIHAMRSANLQFFIVK